VPDDWDLAFEQELEYARGQVQVVNRRARGGRGGGGGGGGEGGGAGGVAWGVTAAEVAQSRLRRTTTSRFTVANLLGDPKERRRVSRR